MKNPYKLGDNVVALKYDTESWSDGTKSTLPAGAVGTVCHNDNPNYVIVEGWDTDGERTVFNYNINDIRLATEQEVEDYFNTNFKFHQNDIVKILVTQTDKKTKQTVLKGSIGKIIYNDMKWVSVATKDTEGNEVTFDYKVEDLELVETKYKN